MAIPGLSEGLRTVKGTGKMLWLMYRGFSRTHDAYEELSKINCPTLIIGGGVDKIVGGAEVHQEMAEARDINCTGRSEMASNTSLTYCTND